MTQKDYKASSGKNRLSLEKNPYLLQHADNPVDWYPWRDEAFKKARREDIPIFLSIGYSTCHWCHVMAHESFEDPEVAELLNRTFVCIKVDREERPDIDSIYMAVCQMMTGSGGWPLTIIMTPDKHPFFAATYIPKNSRFGRMGLMELVPRINNLWRTKRTELLDSADKVVDALKKSGKNPQGSFPDKTILDTAFKNLNMRFDNVNGGFGSAPKFPTPHNIMLLLRYWKRTGNKDALKMAGKTLVQMKRGGIYDHIGYGFHRYSTDRKWIVPHFEKMLYDQALLAIAYMEAWQATGNKDFSQTAEEILTYVHRDLTDRNGGFMCAEDADSEGREGAFYLWRIEEIRNILPPDEAEIAVKFFNLKDTGNFENEASNIKTGENILHVTESAESFALKMKMPEKTFTEKLNSIKSRLFRYRQNRVRPARDYKILTDWNGLMIAAFAKSGRIFKNQEFTNSAIGSAGFILKNMHRNDGRLMHRYCDGQTAVLATLDDYAFLVWGLIELYETTFEIRWLKAASALNNEMMEHFQDRENGGFYTTADDAGDLIVRQKEIYDGAIPSGNSVAALNLLRLSRITGDQALEEKACQLCSCFSKQIETSPLAYTFLLCALDFAFGPSHEIVIAGIPGRDDTESMLDTLNRNFIPSKVVILRPDNMDNPEITEFAPFCRFQRSISNKATAYVCSNFQCSRPTNNMEEMMQIINGNIIRKE